MKTNDLISTLSHDEPPRASHFNLLTILAVSAFTVTALMFLVAPITGVTLRPEYLSAVSHLIVAMKQIVPLILIIALFFILKKVDRPEFNIGARAFWLSLPYIGIMLGLFLWAWFNAPEGQIGMDIVGKSRLKCLFFIPVFSIPIYFGLVHIIRNGAPASPIHTGFWIGIMSGAVGSFIYAFTCNEDSPLFYALWYSVGIIVMGIIGIITGSRLLRW